MKYTKTHALFALFAILAILYASGIYLTQKLTAELVELPTKLSFVIIQGPEDACKNCFDANSIVQSLESSQKTTYKTKNFSYNNPLSKQYIEKYQIQNLPAIVVSGDITNEKVAGAWKSLSGKEINKSIVLENLLPHYDIKSTSVKGVIDAILIKDATCTDCFDENIYLNILKNFGLIVNSTSTYDVGSPEGKMLVETYAITKVPTLILSAGTKEYANFVNAWSEVGTIEADGTLVLRDVDKINPQFKEL
ncbi:MAG: hypothetical protein Q8P72_05750 [Candidatus Roizmanbacteria bacterium]|nr:hypothetical protein [Candidatus Roizmanbacteria bacterium]